MRTSIHNDTTKNNEHELFVTTHEFQSLDDCIDDANNRSPELFSIVNLVRGRSPPKKRKLTDLKPIVFVRFNTRMGKAKPITLKCLLDTGASGSLIAEARSEITP